MASSGYGSPPPIGRTVDRVFEDAQFTGEIYLNGRKLRDYPKLCSKYDLSDTVLIDISRNRLIDVPQEVCDCLYVEKVNCYHNVIRSIPEAIQQLQYLTHLNLSRNQLSVLPPALCLLGCLEVLWASNNKLVSLPEEIGMLKGLMDLDVSCNEISLLPPQIGDLSSLRSLNLRRNYLIELPIEISRLLLYKLDFSSNRIEKIPNVFRKMETLEYLVLDHNPLASPSAHACIKGRQHIMKYLQNEAVKEDRKRGILINSDLEMKRFVRKSLPPQQSSEELKTLLGAPESKWKRHTVLNASDSGYSTADGIERNGWHSAEEQHRQKAECEWNKKQVELVRVSQDEGVSHNKEDGRRVTAQRGQEDQRPALERHAELRGEEVLGNPNEEGPHKDRRKEEEEDSWRREEDLRRLQETVIVQSGVELRLAGDAHKVESKLADRNMIQNNFHYTTSSSSQNCNRPQHPPPVPPSSSSSSRLPQPPSYLPVHGLMGSLSSSSSLSSTSMSSSSSSSYHVSPQLQQDDSNYIINENDHSSQGVKDQRRLANSTQYRRTASSGLKKPSQSNSSQQLVDNLNYVNRNGTSEISQQSSTSTTPSVSPGPSPRNSVSLLAKPNSPSGSSSHLAKNSSPSGSSSHLAKPSSPSGSSSHLAKPTSPSGSSSHLAKPSSTKSSVPRATNGPISSAQSQAVRRTKMALDNPRIDTSSPGATKSIKAVSSITSTQAPTLGLVQPQIRRSSNSNATDEDSKLKKGPSTPAEPPRPKSRLEEPSKKASLLTSGLKMQKVAPQEMVDTNKRISMRPPTNSFGLGRGKPAVQKAPEDPSSNFTLRRREEQQREEAEQLDRLRQTVESRLRVTLPDNLAEALRDGVVLCHLANQIRPRSVGSIHVPSPAVPKLTLAKCRRNVDNFLDACRKIGVEQELICGPQDILDDKGLMRVTITVGALVAIGANPKQSAV